MGKRVEYYRLVAHYSDRLAACDNSLAALVRAEFPRLGPGSFGSLHHPLIHAGYGYSVEDTDTVIEGLAYMHHSYAGFTFANGRDLIKSVMGKGTSEVLDVIESLRKDDALYEYMEKAMESDRAKKYTVGKDQIKFLMLSDRGDDFLDYVAQIR